MMDLRDSYLKNHWAPYPPMPEGATIFGRIRSIEKSKIDVDSSNSGANHSVRGENSTTNSENRSSNDEYSSAKIEKQMDYQTEIFLDQKNHLKKISVVNSALVRILVPGDIIAISKDHEVILLAPSLIQNPLKKPLQMNQERMWCLFLNKIRLYFTSQNFTEVTTPGLVVCPGTEPSLEVFSTEFYNGSRRQKLFLPTSPELHLKKMLSQGAHKIFEIKPAYRNGEVTERHQPEFTLIEWYRAFSNLEAIKKDVVSLIQYLVCDQELRTGAADCGWNFPSQCPQFDFLKIPELFHHQNIKMKPDSSLEDYKTWVADRNIQVHGSMTKDDYFFLLMNDLIEPDFDPYKITFVEDYPPFQAALARLTFEGWGDRFEFYWKGLEIANAFHELNDPLIQRQRAQEDLEKKKCEGRSDIALDEDFLKSLEYGMPPSGGIALGLERLFMALFDLRNIQDSRYFANWE